MTIPSPQWGSVCVARAAGNLVHPSKQTGNQMQRKRKNTIQSLNRLGETFHCNTQHEEGKPEDSGLLRPNRSVLIFQGQCVI